MYKIFRNIAIISALMLPVAFTGCGDDNDEMNRYTFMPVESTKTDTLICTIAPTDMLNINTLFTVKMPSNKASKVRMEFSCSNIVKWEVIDIPADLKVEPTSGAGTGFFTINVPQASQATKHEMRFYLKQLKQNGDIDRSLTHRIIIAQP